MSGEAIKRPRMDEDTDMGFLGHMTNQTADEPERDLDDRERRETGPERSPVEPRIRKQQRENKHNHESRK
jgi:hypothetical protein